MLRPPRMQGMIKVSARQALNTDLMRLEARVDEQSSLFRAGLEALQAQMMVKMEETQRAIAKLTVELRNAEHHAAAE